MLQRNWSRALLDASDAISVGIQAQILAIPEIAKFMSVLETLQDVKRIDSGLRIPNQNNAISSNYLEIPQVHSDWHPEH